ncbi:MAG: TonB-dependent receptor plug domain-containing protein, partial [Lentisphaerae bacterium]|nr:TonB-dependent receptor plug domain-containing protein [Lentisphaerota bacterium]
MLACLAAALALRGAAETNGPPRVTFDPLLVTARGRAAPASLTPGGVSVVEGTDLAGLQPVSVAGAAPYVPGVARAADGPWAAECNIRGLSRESVVLLIDGARVNTATDLGARFGLIDPREIERIEFLKGPVSALYGSGSLGGVVNVITRRARFADAPVLGGGAAGFLTDNGAGYRLHGFGSYADRRSAVYVSQSARDAASYEDGDGETVPNSGFSDTATKVRVGRRVGRRWELDLNLQHVAGRDIGIPGSGTAPLPAAADVTYPRTRRALAAVTATLRPAAGAVESAAWTAYAQAIDRRVRIDNFPAA